MRIVFDAILGLLACASITVPTLNKASWEEQIAYAGIAVLLAALIFMLHVKPHDNAEELINSVKAQNHLAHNPKTPQQAAE